MKRLAARCLLLALPSLLLLAPSSHAVSGGLDDVPAATLLLPYFEVNLDNPQGLTTLFSVTNARQEATLVHITLWTDLGIPTLDFNVYLTGYDIQTFNLRDLFTTGFTPQTASAGQDPSDTISNQGNFSLDTNFTSCSDQLPLPPWPALLIDHIRAAHTGKASAIFSGKCSGENHGDNIARGYLTLDQVDSCTLEVPTDADYYATGVLGFDNTLLGDYFYVDAGQNFAQGETMVHLEANPSLDADNYTFYRALSGGADRREGLANAFSARFVRGGAFSGGTDFVVWRDPRREVAHFTCGGALPPPFPLATDELAAFDEAENVEVLGDTILDPPPPPAPAFPLATQRVSPGGNGLEISWEFGWLYVNLNTVGIGSTVPFDRVSQGFVNVVMKANSRFSVGFDAYQLSNITDPADAILDRLGPPTTP